MPLNNSTASPTPISRNSESESSPDRICARIGFKENITLAFKPALERTGILPHVLSLSSHLWCFDLLGRKWNK